MFPPPPFFLSNQVRLPHLIIDKYTGVTLAWAFNEPVIQLPLIGTILTVMKICTYISRM
jgi:hypothetical protein